MATLEHARQLPAFDSVIAATAWGGVTAVGIMAGAFLGHIRSRDA